MGEMQNSCVAVFQICPKNFYVNLMTFISYVLEQKNIAWHRLLANVNFLELSRLTSWAQCFLCPLAFS